jgi:ADP-ribose pyrophosphatase YjhB (NUDIX family)
MKEQAHEVLREYPEHPLVGVGALVIESDKILVVKRENEPGKGLWSIPGGLLELGERVRDGAVRETEEETGIKIEIDSLIDVVDSVTKDENGRIRYHYVLIDFLAHPIGGKLNPNSDVKEAKWVTFEELKRLPTTRTLKYLLEKVLKK